MASKPCWCRDIETGSEWAKVCEKLSDRAQQAEQDLAAANATIAAQALALATMRDVVEKVHDYGTMTQAELDEKYPRPHISGLRLLAEVLAAAQPPPADDAAALAGAVLTAADRMAEMIERCEWAITTESHGALTDSKNAYRRASSALRGHGAAEG